MAKESRSAACIFLCAIALFIFPTRSFSLSGEEKMFSRIQLLHEKGEPRELLSIGEEFKKKYPKSSHLGEVLYFMGERAPSANLALKYYRSASAKLKGNRSLDARLNICRILHLTSRWKDLEEEARSAIALAESDARKADFMLHLARAYISEEEYEKTADLCEKTIKMSNRPSHVMPALLMLSHAERKTTGYSRGYFSILRDIIEGFNQSENACVALYLLGRAHQERGDFDRAYSAYREVVSKYPRSPEASFAAERIASLQRHNPKTVAFLPDEQFLRSLDRIELPSFQNSLDEEPAKKSFFAIMLGPVEEKSDALKIAKSIKSEFAPVKIVHNTGGYAVYAGKLRDTKSASTMKIRLAEEMGYNGRIVRLRIEDNKTYIYGE